ncbi:MAG: ABC transporter permease [Planctomycetes bacterium]|nr:ABC transporter permease [Planctomycetota bacterium]
MYKWFFAWRYLHTKLIAIFGVASVTLCVAMVLVVLSVMGGFLDTLRERSRGLHSEIVLDANATLQGFPYYQQFEAHLQEHLPDVVRTTTPAIYSYGIVRVRATAYTRACRVLGIRLSDYVQVNEFGNGLHYESFYPGTTKLGAQRMPVAGFSEGNKLVLPPDLEQASAAWRAKQTDPAVISEYDAHPFAMAEYPKELAATSGGNLVFSMDFESPRYAGPEHHGVIIGSDLLFARLPNGKFDRYLARGANISLTLMPLSQTGNPTGEPPVKLPLRYVDDSHTGIFEIDDLCVYVDFDMVQHKLGMDPQPKVDGGTTAARTNQLLISLQPGVELYESKARITDAWNEFLFGLDRNLSDADVQSLSFVKVHTWEDLQRTFINAVEKEKVLVTFLFALISIVAIVLLGCIFYMIVEKKTRDIGTLKALGASSGGVASIFISYALVVGVTGSVLGTIVGSLFVWNINGIQDFLASLNPELRVWSPEVYSFDKIPEVVKTADAIWVASIAVVSSVVGALIPAAIAGRVWPVQALRYE